MSPASVAAALFLLTFDPDNLRAYVIWLGGAAAGALVLSTLLAMLTLPSWVDVWMDRIGGYLLTGRPGSGIPTRYKRWLSFRLARLTVHIDRADPNPK